MKTISEQNRDNSYKELQPKLPLRQKTVYALIQTYGPMTISEIAQKMVLPPGRVSARIRELDDMCLIKIDGSKKSDVTGIKSTLWQIVPMEDRKALKEDKIHDLMEKAVHLSVDLGNVASHSAVKLISDEIDRVNKKLEILI